VKIRRFRKPSVPSPRRHLRIATPVDLRVFEASLRHRIEGHVVHQVHQDEVYWGGFLIDEDADAVQKILGGKRAKAHDDPDIVEEASKGNCTPVTSNGDDFIRHILGRQRRENGRECRDAWGLLIVPNAGFTRGRVLPEIKGGIVVGNMLLRWPAIGFLNLCVHVHASGRVDVRRFARCSFCQREYPYTLPWYAALREIRK
jgi:hypothetical protein